MLYPPWQGAGELQDHGLQPAAGGPRAGPEGGEPGGPRGQPQGPEGAVLHGAGVHPGERQGPGARGG